MRIMHWILITVSIFLLNLWKVETLLTNFQATCVPTASVKGPCHTCVCNSESMFECHATTCERSKNVNPKKSIKDECQPYMIYKFGELFCTCNYNGRWMSYNCRETFQYLRTSETMAKDTLRSNITCTPNALFLVDCNVCHCDKSGIIKSSFCTKRQCFGGHKADLCNFGDFLRTNDEICICSDINYYIDRLCVKVDGETIQEISNTKIDEIIQNINPIRKSMTNETCIPYQKYTIDCNSCICSSKGELVCTNKICKNDKLESKTKYRDNDFLKLTKVEDEEDKCNPGQKYRFKCNTCICTHKKTLSCTTMVCLEDYND
ncbi:uncharacterized protein LOC124540254 [Vanessa cardui]|uniref:uncharacterized protein LOC124540254 n=1 Tax=Vanessa cardui TaxID=171605 RepID=UPI001F13F0D6|nr:uncharacterized protein LOC124540254 [Vanessa cardui]